MAVPNITIHDILSEEIVNYLCFFYGVTEESITVVNGIIFCYTDFGTGEMRWVEGGTEEEILNFIK